MTDLDEESPTAYLVLVNDEEQHSLWPTMKEIPRGWSSVHGPASKDECLEYVEREWKDITPLSVRKQLAAVR
jgi:MbtH protein